MRHFYRMMTVIILTCIMLCGCSKENPPDKIADADFTVITGSDIPEELQSLINERKKNPFSLTFTRSILPLCCQRLWQAVLWRL